MSTWAPKVYSVHWYDFMTLYQFTLRVMTEGCLLTTKLVMIHFTRYDHHKLSEESQQYNDELYRRDPRYSPCLHAGCTLTGCVGSSGRHWEIKNCEMATIFRPNWTFKSYFWFMSPAITTQAKCSNIQLGIIKQTQDGSCNSEMLHPNIYLYLLLSYSLLVILPIES